ncbi:hypothetical protein RND81_03G212300 [Saponaria officinalis]|uniref:RING-type E3 ubiquitin transferase n=1 Tax=Saponaria officinalis TaxID=3572 RepID=A0AAW1M844_SAPOF
MGGCCCSARKAQLQGTPVYYYCPPSLEAQENLRSYGGTASGLPTGFLVGLNLDTSSPDTFRPPPAPIPFNVLFGRPQTPIHARGSQGPKGDIRQTDTETTGNYDKITPAGHGKSEGKTLADILLASPTKSDLEISKPSDGHHLPPEEEDACPICLEEYDKENPKMVTTCEHDFHLSCLLEWMERSDSCPVCDKEMIFDPPGDRL